MTATGHDEASEQAIPPPNIDRGVSSGLGHILDGTVQLSLCRELARSLG
jgi:hypothetical protein